MGVEEWILNLRDTNARWITVMHCLMNIISVSLSGGGLIASLKHNMTGSLFFDIIGHNSN